MTPQLLLLYTSQNWKWSYRSKKYAEEVGCAGGLFQCGKGESMTILMGCLLCIAWRREGSGSSHCGMIFKVPSTLQFYDFSDSKLRANASQALEGIIGSDIPAIHPERQCCYWSCIITVKHLEYVQLRHCMF